MGNGKDVCTFMQRSTRAQHLVKQLYKLHYTLVAMASRLALYNLITAICILTQGVHFPQTYTKRPPMLKRKISLFMIIRKNTASV